MIPQDVLRTLEWFGYTAVPKDGIVKVGAYVDVDARHATDCPEDMETYVNRTLAALIGAQLQELILKNTKRGELIEWYNTYRFSIEIEVINSSEQS